MSRFVLSTLCLSTNDKGLKAVYFLYLNSPDFIVRPDYTEMNIEDFEVSVF